MNNQHKTQVFVALTNNQEADHFAYAYTYIKISRLITIQTMGAVLSAR